MNAGMVAEWLASGELVLPLPGRGSTAARWRRLADLTETDIVAGRLAEAHADAVAILADLEGPDVQPDELWGVWAAEAPDAVVHASDAGAFRMWGYPYSTLLGAGLIAAILLSTAFTTEFRMTLIYGLPVLALFCAAWGLRQQSAKVPADH